MPFDQNGNWYDDTEYDPYATQDYGVAGQYYTPEQLQMMEQMLGGPLPSFDPQMGMDPTMTSMFGGMAMPQMDTKGRIQPRDLGVQTQLTNFGQDIGSSIGNNMMAYMAGPGSYAPGALDPVFDETPLQATQQYQLQAMAQSGGIQGTIADLIMGGMNAGKATARVRDMLKNPEKYPNVITPEEAADMRNELDVIPADPMNGIEEGPDYNSIGKIAENIYKPYLAEQGMLNQPNIRMNADGQYVQVAQRDSPQMEWLKKMGLPDPRAQYDVKYALESDPTLVGMLGQVAQSQGDRDLMRKEFEDRLKRTRKYREDDLKNRATDAKNMERYYGATKQAMSDYFGEMGRVGSDRSIAQAQAARGLPAVVDPATLDPEMYNAQGLRKEAYEEGPGDMPGWLKSAGNFVESGVKGIPGLVNDTVARVAGKPIAPAGAQRQPSNVDFLPESEPDVINGITLPEMVLPARPKGRNEPYTMMDQLLGKNLTDPGRPTMRQARQRAADEAINPAVRAHLYMAAQQAHDKKNVSAMTKYMLGLAPTVVAGRQGRSPRTDAIQQRLAPLYQIGALGQGM